MQSPTGKLFCPLSNLTRVRRFKSSTFTLGRNQKASHFSTIRTLLTCCAWFHTSRSPRQLFLAVTFPYRKFHSAVFSPM
jgi:hypothetical protein